MAGVKSHHPKHHINSLQCRYKESRHIITYPNMDIFHLIQNFTEKSLLYGLIGKEREQGKGGGDLERDSHPVSHTRSGAYSRLDTALVV